MKKIVVNEEACIGCGACVSIDSEHFEFNDEGLSHATNNDNLDSNDLASAISSCPTGAISIEDNEDTNSEKEDICSCKSCECTKENTCGCHCEED